MEILYNSETTRVSVINKDTDHVYISFNGLTGESIGDEMAEVMEEFKSLAKNSTVFFVADKTMSWGNHLDWEAIVKVLRPYLKKKTITTVGLSMGGSNAILATQFFKVYKVIAFNPQYTIYPEFYPETEYLLWAEKIKSWRFKTIYSGFSKDTIYFLFWSSIHRPDTLFKGLFPTHADVFDFGHGCGHNIAGDLKANDKLARLFELCETNNVKIIDNFVKEYTQNILSHSQDTVPDKSCNNG